MGQVCPKARQSVQNEEPLTVPARHLGLSNDPSTELREIGTAHTVMTVPWANCLKTLICKPLIPDRLRRALNFSV